MDNRQKLVAALGALPVWHFDIDEPIYLDSSVVKVFTPDASATWYLAQRDDDGLRWFGLCDLGLGFPELGWVGQELLEVRGKLGLLVEMDEHWSGMLGDGYDEIGLARPPYIKSSAQEVT